MNIEAICMFSCFPLLSDLDRWSKLLCAFYIVCIYNDPTTSGIISCFYSKLSGVSLNMTTILLLYSGDKLEEFVVYIFYISMQSSDTQRTETFAFIENLPPCAYCISLYLPSD